MGPDLTTFGAVHISFLDFGHLKVPVKDRTVPTWIYYKVKSPRIFKEGLKMPDYYFNEEESVAITTYILGLNKQISARRPHPRLAHLVDFNHRDPLARRRLLPHDAPV